LAEEVTWHALDVSDPAAVNAVAQVADILVNNAGVQVEKTVADSTDADWDLVMGVNARGVFNCCRAFIPLMPAGASIINIGSISGKVADPSMALYNASKAFVHGLTRSIAVDHGPDIRCNAICPGWIETGMLDAGFDLARDPAKAKQDALARHATRRFGKPADIAAMAVWLASDEAGFATGQLFTVDGGMTAASPLNPGLF
jgi:meso-butanediol dehydrogenase/(S,S)-butanediol dehydrogenase/diacetyl reductase